MYDIYDMIQGYNGSQLWDVSFAIQVIISTNLVDKYDSMLKKAYYFIKNTQVLSLKLHLLLV